jgi:hypothetical protein
MDEGSASVWPHEDKDEEEKKEGKKKETHLTTAHFIQTLQIDRLTKLQHL